jgi:hypothetical protein
VKRRIAFAVAFVITLLVIYSFEITSATEVVDDQKQPSTPIPQPTSSHDDNSTFVSNMFSSLKKAFDSNKEQLRSIIEKGEKTTPVLVKKPSGFSPLDIDFVHIASEWYWTYHQIAIVENDDYIIGESNGLVTHMHASGDDAEAFIVGHLSSTCNGGAVSVTCSLGHTNLVELIYSSFTLVLTEKIGTLGIHHILLSLGVHWANIMSPLSRRLLTI